MQSQGQSRESRIVEQRRTEKLAAVSIRNRNRQTKRPRSGGWRRRRRRRSAYTGIHWTLHPSAFMITVSLPEGKKCQKIQKKFLSELNYANYLLSISY